MEFIERLRQKQEARERENTRQRHHQEEEQRRRLADWELQRIRHQERRAQAAKFYRESGLGNLIEELGCVIYDTSDHDYFYIEGEDVDSKWYKIGWDRKVKDYNWGNLRKSEKFLATQTLPDGTIKFHAGLLGSSRLPLEYWQNNKKVLEEALEKAYRHPGTHSWIEPRDGRIHRPQGGAPGPCLPGYMLISTPSGLISVKNLKIGDYVWTVDGFGRKVKTVVVKKIKRPAAKNHKMVHVVLKDGRELVVSPGHPTIDYKMIGSLVKGDDLDMSFVVSIKVVPYKDKYTYDILPYGDTGGYWVNNILIGSTLSSQFERTTSDGFPLFQVY